MLVHPKQNLLWSIYSDSGQYTFLETNIAPETRPSFKMRFHLRTIHPFLGALACCSFQGGYTLVGDFKHFVCSPRTLGEMIQFDEHIFQMGWFNHQLVSVPCKILWEIWSLPRFGWKVGSCGWTQWWWYHLPSKRPGEIEVSERLDGQGCFRYYIILVILPHPVKITQIIAPNLHLKKCIQNGPGKGNWWNESMKIHETMIFMSFDPFFGVQRFACLLRNLLRLQLLGIKSSRNNVWNVQVLRNGYNMDIFFCWVMLV